jgi:hypothetical protein
LPVGESGASASSVKEGSERRRNWLTRCRHIRVEQVETARAEGNRREPTAVIPVLGGLKAKGDPGAENSTPNTSQTNSDERMIRIRPVSTSTPAATVTQSRVSLRVTRFS